MKFFEILAGKLEPAGEWVAANNSGAQRLLFHVKGIEAALGRDFKLDAWPGVQSVPRFSYSLAKRRA